MIKREDLLKIQKPARYLGDEKGIPKKDFKNSTVKFVLSYPDIYEIGMSNHGLKILYNLLNDIDYVCCERVFSPWYDMEELLRKNENDLFSLESKSSIIEFDVLGISIQYELLFSNFLQIIDLSNIAVYKEMRKEDDPLVVLGGPVITSNPLPFSDFADLFVIGEGEEVIVKIAQTIKDAKDNGLSRFEKIKILSQLDGVYSPHFPKDNVKRQIYTDFGNNNIFKNYIIPSIDIIQNKLVVEVMRGCPNKCRFCQAGVIYKPYREKQIDVIIDEIESGINATGVNEVTFSSLSTSDYSKLLDLIEFFNNNYQSKGISASLPSLKVESFDISLLESLSVTRKSGLTFAVETGTLEGQKALNKPVLLDTTLKIIREAVDKGWKLIKLYFMIGLPNIDNEVDSIIAFIDNIRHEFNHLMINVNVAVFTPKANTPFQYAEQIGLEESKEAFKTLEDYYRRGKVRIKKHDPYASHIEGVISRGDSEVGKAMYIAYKNGARFDGWHDKFNYSRYIEAFSEAQLDYKKYLSAKSFDEVLPWHFIETGLTDEYLQREFIKSSEKELTPSCKEICEKECTICKDNVKKIESDKKEISFKNKNKNKNDNNENQQSEEKRFYYYLEFNKKDAYQYIGHIDLLRLFEKFFRISKLPIYYTKGFNPHPKFQFSGALSVGILSSCEILAFYTVEDISPENIKELLTSVFPEGLSINKVRKVPLSSNISLLDHIFLSRYVVLFDNMYYNIISEKINKFKEQETYLFVYEKKNKQIEVDLKEYVSFNLKKDGDNVKVEIDFYHKKNAPKLITVVDDFFDLSCSIERVGIFAEKGDKLVPLYDI